MISIEKSGSEWRVVQDGNAVSVHPTREEAERAVEWLTKNHDHAVEVILENHERLHPDDDAA